MQSRSSSLHSHRSQRTATGFTLVEVVIAISILAVMLSIGYGALRSILRGREILDDGRDVRVVADSVMSRLNRELQLAVSGVSLIPPQSSGGDTAPPTSSRNPLIGESSTAEEEANATITFIADGAGQALPDGTIGATGLVQITYRIAELPPEDQSPSTAKALIREELPYIRPFERAYKRRVAFPIASSVVSFQLWFYEAQTQQWVTSWGDSSREGLPTMIRYSLTLKAPSGRKTSYTSAVPLRADPP